MPDLWDPLTSDNLMPWTVTHFEKQALRPLDDTEGIEGPGIYALYYNGTMVEYKPIAYGTRPIYVGKAVLPGSKAGSGDPDPNHPALRRRLNEHAHSIEEVNNLAIGEFSYRALAIVPVWIVVAERALIKKYRPVWNSCLYGFGKHNQGKRRSRTVRSWWDTLHPGRSWTKEETQTRTVDEARKRLRDFWESSKGVGNHE